MRKPKTIKVTLSDPIQIGEEDVTELEVIEPTPRIIRKYGYPVGAKGNINDEAIYGLIFQDRYPNAVIDQISAADYLRLTEALMDFFGQSESSVKES